MITYRNMITQDEWGMIINQPLYDLKPSKVDAIALHHMAHPTADIKTIERWHLDLGWRALGYNFWIGSDGKIYEGRGFQLGAGVENQNDHIISIGFQGDYHSQSVDMPDAQFNAGIDVIQYVLTKVPTIKTVGGHGDFMATACPGQYFPVDGMLTYIKREKSKDDPSIPDIINELIWRGIITEQILWNEKGSVDEDIKWLFVKYYPYIMKNSGTVKNPLSVSNVDEALVILKSRGVVAENYKWISKAAEDENIKWLLSKMADYIN